MGVLAGVLGVLAFGILPMLVYTSALWWFDRYEKEPIGLLAAAFLWGAVPAVVFSVVVELVLDVPVSFFVGDVAASVVSVAVVAPLVEELCKGAALVLLFLFFRRELDSPLDGIIYGGLVGFGFAAVENVFYFAGGLAEGGPERVFLLAALRAFLFGLNHALFTGLFGLGIALARTERTLAVKLAAPAVGLLLALTAHGIHNASVTLGAEAGWPCLVAVVTDWAGVLLLLGIVVWTSLRERRWISEFLADEVAGGALSEEDHAIASSYWRRVSQRWEALLRGEFRRWWRLERYFGLLTELAFTKHRLADFPDEQETRDRLPELRKQAQLLGKQLI
jgi:RsiW-degrading membrane proteinase PrsW (M82 family)